jgi:hypothetical protein
VFYILTGEVTTLMKNTFDTLAAAIGRFVPPQKSEEQILNGETKTLPPPKWLDPKMRKSTEFPPWLDKPETREEMKGKQVLMYCTGKC